jgi:hypothetical protein
VSSEAAAHPFGDTVVAQRLDVDVAIDRLRVGLVVDAPPEALEEAAGALAPEVWLDRLAVGLAVSVDGVSVTPTIERRDQRLDLVGMHTRTYELVLAVPLDLSVPRHIEVTNGNLLGQGGWYVSTATFDPAVRHLDSSLLVTPRRGATVDLSGQWSRSELRRRLRLTVDAPPTPWRRLVANLDLPTVSPTGADLNAPVKAWRGGLGSADGLGFAALLGLVAGGAAGAAPVDRRRVAITALAAGVGWASAVALPAGAGLMILASAAAMAAWRRSPAPVWAVALLALCAPAPLRALTFGGLAVGIAVGAAVPARWRGKLPAAFACGLTAAALATSAT